MHIENNLIKRQFNLVFFISSSILILRASLAAGFSLYCCNNDLCMLYPRYPVNLYTLCIAKVAIVFVERFFYLSEQESYHYLHSNYFNHFRYFDFS